MGKRRRQDSEKDTSETEENMSLVPSSDHGEEKQLHRIMCVTDRFGELHFVVKWKDGSVGLLPAKEANVKYTQEVIRYYEVCVMRRSLRLS
ncbi:hypothetical protein KIN20_003933 [Parelaphostrongylus tenuis]|uniref:Chromo shadow domain-containing protein n=1 Tax=Parelaphostrongylus tenuis TaxID=148309 RepID=A0AAD5QIY2_PARTN|nr:hypothetical protein KIN20_003933 [Parelaphostrongylus tenuis]